MTHLFKTQKAIQEEIRQYTENAVRAACNKGIVTERNIGCIPNFFGSMASYLELYIFHNDHGVIKSEEDLQTTLIAVGELTLHEMTTEDMDRFDNDDQIAEFIYEFINAMLDGFYPDEEREKAEV